MKIELRCPSCGRSFLAGEESRGAPCPGCGVTLGPKAETAPKTPPPARPAAAPAQPPAPAAKLAAPAQSAAAVAAPVAAPVAAEEIVCPRCSLHFTPRTATGSASSEERKTVLVVEDMEYFLDIVCDALEPQFVVEAAKTVEEARTALTAGEIDLILLDLTLGSGEDGTGLLRELPFKPCPILLLTAEDESLMYGETWKKLQDLGVDDVVTKGMNVGELILRKVGTLLGQPTEDDGSRT